MRVIVEHILFLQKIEKNQAIEEQGSEAGTICW
jgi:hypothetical protein